MITHARCLAWLEDLHDGVHQPGDAYHLALYTDAATLDDATRAYTPDGEVTGEGYAAGGLLLAGRRRARFEDVSGPGIGVTFDDPVWPVATITAHGALLYNATRDYRALAVLRFRNAPVASTNGRFRVSLADAGLAALLQLR